MPHWALRGRGRITWTVLGRCEGTTGSVRSYYTTYNSAIWKSGTLFPVDCYNLIKCRAGRSPQDHFRPKLWTSDRSQRFQWGWTLCEVQVRTGTPERGKWRGHCPLFLQNRVNGTEVPFHNNIIGNCIVYQNRIETHLLQLFAHQENSDGFSKNSVVIFEVNIVVKQKQAYNH